MTSSMDPCSGCCGTFVCLACTCGVPGGNDAGQPLMYLARSGRRTARQERSRPACVGDAIHAMTSGRGEGARTALRDAALLAAG